MELHNIPEAFQTKLRISIISCLITGSKIFKELKGITEATDGNLGAQLNKLEDMGYVHVKKEFVNKKPQSTYVLSEVGVNKFKEYVAMLEEVLQNSPHQ